MMLREHIDTMLNGIERDPLRAALVVLAALVVTIGVALVFAIPAHAADATVSWTAPTQNTDGTAIPASGAGSLTGTRVEYGTCSGALFGTKAGEVTVPAPTSSVVISGFSPGSTACFRAYSSNTFGVESAASAVASKTWPAPTPKPPVIATVSGLVWELRLDKDGGLRLAREVGTVDAGRLCLGLAPIYGEDLFVITRAGVSFTRGVKRDAVLVAQCEVT
jgi:hypothetical protein